MGSHISKGKFSKKPVNGPKCTEPVTASTSEGQANGHAHKYVQTEDAELPTKSDDADIQETSTGSTETQKHLNPKNRPSEADVPFVNEDQKKIIVKTWNIIKEDIAKVGVITFTKLFETHPDVKEAFLHLKDMSQEELEYSDILKRHTLRVMQSVDKAVSRIHKPVMIHNVFLELGERHIDYHAEPRIVDLMVVQFIEALHSRLPAEHWNEETEQAWQQFLEYTMFFLKVPILCMRKT
ncbi:non-symbiotic hemoglobin [Lingula anatina]|uniref:Non-symbiotic hemoglobin n=1 Tax=Lingula anatina TaxID=7574 RepID=A0A1S3HH40_LINAN|nr:non-symbiotic hemoglobin [Lingula anatina]XP_013384340.1 non-symbiotic hemoglobin [Lingula anatina]XP_013384341.1 non-symbiotic hemoglobin [Lingula anatina]XP_013384344.1 non-symbiotic hemoglobin [Lingula anatina]XP_013384345.1 non-symbiotic hemoglobin [Lingula anatina]XP_013384346.1 non-symbiotic hemoglobin [Lingula anatina]|eukprot:XP_013384339.1 non-symbiotic hemoglobin [Lingula anatina]